MVREAEAMTSCEANAGPRRVRGPLSAREAEVAQLIARGTTSAEVAEALVFTPPTADTHADNIHTKLGLRSRAEIAVWSSAHL